MSTSSVVLVEDDERAVAEDLGGGRSALHPSSDGPERFLSLLLALTRGLLTAGRAARSLPFAAGREVQVPQRRRRIHMAGKLLDRLRRSTVRHGQKVGRRS